MWTWRARARAHWHAGDAAARSSALLLHAHCLVTHAPSSTCHVVLSKEYYDKTVSDGEPSDEENDLLDLA